MKTIAVIITIYNKADYILACLDSVFNNSVLPDEIILINDGSTDQSFELIETYNFNTLSHSIINKKNEGVSISRNLGIAIVKSDYFLFIDADDIIENELIEKLHTFCDEDEVEIVSYNVQKRNIELGKIAFIDKHQPDLNTGSDFLQFYLEHQVNFAVACGYCYKTSFFKSNNFEFSPGKYHEDYGLIPLVLFTAEKMISMAYVGYTVFMVPNSIMRNNDYSFKVKKAFDTLNLSKHLLLKFSQFPNIQSYIYQLITNFVLNAMFSKVTSLDKQEQYCFLLTIHEYKMERFIKCSSSKMIFRKILLSYSPNTYARYFGYLNGK